MTLSERIALLFETFQIPITQKILRVLTTMCLHVNWKVHIASELVIYTLLPNVYDFSRSQVENGNISEMVLDSNRKRQYGLSNNSSQKLVN